MSLVQPLGTGLTPPFSTLAPPLGVLTPTNHFSPTSIPGLIAWYDATKITGQADGSNLTSWPDSSGNGHTLSAHLTGPLYYNTTAAKLINGKPAVWWSTAIGDYMLAAISHAQPLSFVFIGRTTYATGAGVQPGLLGDDSGGTPKVYLNISLTPTTGWYVANAGVAGTTSPTADNSLHMVIAIYNGASSVVVRDGTAGTTTNIGTNALGSPHIIIGATFGSGPTDTLNGPLAEVLVYAAALNATQQGQLRTYSQKKWGTP